MRVPSTVDPCAALGLALARRRLALGLAMTEVARRAACSHATVSRIECGKYLAPPATVARVAAALGITARQLDWLYEDIRYQQRLAAAWTRLGTDDPATRALLVPLLTGVVLDEQARREVIRALLAIRRGLAARGG